MLKSDSVGLGLLIVVVLSILTTQFLLTSGSSKAPLQSGKPLGGRENALGYWPLPVVVALFVILKGNPLGQAIAITVVTVSNQVWTYWVTRNTAMPKPYRRGIELLSVVAIFAISAYLYLSFTSNVSAA